MCIVVRCEAAGKMIGGDGGGVGNKTTCACVEAGKGRGAMGKGEGGGVRDRVLVGFV